MNRHRPGVRIGLAGNQAASTSSKWTEVTAEECLTRTPTQRELGVPRSIGIRSAAALLPPQSYTTSRIQHAIDADLCKYPSLDDATQDKIVLKFQALHQRVKDEGFYECHYFEYGKEIMRYAALFALFALCLSRSWYFVSACFLGLFWHQIMFTAHDAGHRGITHDFTTDTLIGIFIADLCCGLSIGWWKSSHNVHHLVPNLPVIPSVPNRRMSVANITCRNTIRTFNNVPLFATSPTFFTSIKSSYYGGTCFPWDAFAGLAVSYQKYTYYPVMAVARFNLYFLSWLHLVSSRSRTKGSTRWTWAVEVAGICIYTFLYFYVLLLLLHRHLAVPYRIPADQPFDNHAAACANHALALGYQHRRPRAVGIFRPAPAAYDDGH